MMLCPGSLWPQGPVDSSTAGEGLASPAPEPAIPAAVRISLLACPALQVHLSFAGPGMYVVSWVTFPHLAHDFKQRVEAAAQADASRGNGGGGGGSSTLRGLHDPQGKRELQAQGRNRNHDGCAKLRGLGLRSVVQYGFYPGEYTFEAEGHFKCYSTDEYQSGALHHVTIGDAEGGAAGLLRDG
jgi:hypothetical protein